MVALDDSALQRLCLMIRELSKATGSACVAPDQEWPNEATDNFQTLCIDLNVGQYRRTFPIVKKLFSSTGNNGLADFKSSGFSLTSSLRVCRSPALATEGTPGFKHSKYSKHSPISFRGRRMDSVASRISGNFLWPNLEGQLACVGISELGQDKNLLLHGEISPEIEQTCVGTSVLVAGTEPLRTRGPPAKCSQEADERVPVAEACIRV
jgi:hypothetical protein